MMYWVVPDITVVEMAGAGKVLVNVPATSTLEPASLVVRDMIVPSTVIGFPGARVEDPRANWLVIATAVAVTPPNVFICVDGR